MEVKNNICVKADKSGNLFNICLNKYKQMLNRETIKNYKKLHPF